jgi:transcriptional regulator with XRE-family HTH domain
VAAEVSSTAAGPDIGGPWDFVGNFGGLLKSYRKRRGLTLNDLADKCGLDSGNLSRMERGARRPPKGAVATRLMDALGILKTALRSSNLQLKAT